MVFSMKKSLRKTVQELKLKLNKTVNGCPTENAQLEILLSSRFSTFCSRRNYANLKLITKITTKLKYGSVWAQEKILLVLANLSLKNVITQVKIIC